MRYEAFISYSSLDQPWAAKLHDDLGKRGYADKIFWDKRNLDIGTPWNNQLQDALDESRHLLVLWSPNSAQSRWVAAEEDGFRTLIFKDDKMGVGNNRKLVQICLQGKDDMFKDWQVLDDLDKAAQFAAGASQVDPNVWDTVISKLDTLLNYNDKWPPVFQMVLASTRQAMSNIPLNYKPSFRSRSFGELLRYLHISRDRLLERYGNERGDWTPFGAVKNINTILSELLTDLKSRGGPPFRWQPMGARFWQLPQDSTDYLKLKGLLETQPSMIVIDPLSLYDQEVGDQFGQLFECVYNRYSSVVVLPPFVTRQRDRLREAFGQIGPKFYTKLNEPEFDTARAVKAACSLLTPDEFEVRRVVAASVRLSRDELKNWALAIVSNP